MAIACTRSAATFSFRGIDTWASFSERHLHLPPDTLLGGGSWWSGPTPTVASCSAAARSDLCTTFYVSFVSRLLTTFNSLLRDKQLLDFSFNSHCRGFCLLSLNAAAEGFASNSIEQASELDIARVHQLECGLWQWSLKLAALRARLTIVATACSGMITLLRKQTLSNELFALQPLRDHKLLCVVGPAISNSFIATRRRTSNLSACLAAFLYSARFELSFFFFHN